MTVDPYLIAGTGTLRNIVGITDPVELARLENDLTALRIAQLEAGHRLAGRFDVALRAVHRHIFQDVYGWAGEFRSIAMSKGTDVHPLPQSEYGRTVFNRLATDRFLRGLDHDRFVAKLSQVVADLFAWHPFREGNTRRRVADHTRGEGASGRDAFGSGSGRTPEERHGDDGSPRSRPAPAWPAPSPAGSPQPREAPGKRGAARPLDDLVEDSRFLLPRPPPIRRCELGRDRLALPIERLHRRGVFPAADPHAPQADISNIST